MRIGPVLPGFDPSNLTSSSVEGGIRLELSVDAGNEKELEQLLGRAVNRLIPAALERRRGILISQMVPNRYAIEVSDEVLCGVIEDKRVGPDLV